MGLTCINVCQLLNCWCQKKACRKFVFKKSREVMQRLLLFAGKENKASCEFYFGGLGGLQLVRNSLCITIHLADFKTWSIV